MPTLSPREGHLIPILLAAIFFMPTVVVGYAYSDGPWSLVRHPLLNELLYSALLMFKLLPIAVAALYFAPPPSIDLAARHLRSLAPRASLMAAQRLRQAWHFFAHGPLRGLALAFIAVFLLAFTDFELASLLNSLSGFSHSAFTWTIALHQGQQLYVSPATLVEWAALAAGCEAILMTIGVVVLLRARRGHVGQRTGEASPGRAKRITARITLALAALAILALPGWIILRGCVDHWFEGLRAVLANFRFFDELASSLFFAASAMVSVVAVLFLLPRPMRWLLALPGLLGGIVLAILLLMMFQWPGLDWLANTPLPLALGLLLLLLPIAAVLRGLFDAVEPGTSIHAARMLWFRGDATQHRAGRSILWHLRGRSWLLIAGLVFTLAYFELVVSVTLSPVGMTPAIVALYNLMHFGQRAVLSTMVLITMILPVVIGGAIWLGARSAARKRSARMGLAESRPDR